MKLGRSPIYPKSISSYNPIPNGCVFYAPLWNPDLSGPTFKSIDSYGHICTRVGGVMDGSGFTADGDDYIDGGSNSVLNLTGAMSIGAWAKSTNLTAYNEIFNRGLFGVDGYRMAISNTGQLLYESNQTPAANQDTLSSAGDVVTGTWYFLLATRSGAVAKLYKNGADITATSGSHVNPTTATRSALIGRYATAQFYHIGTIGEVWVYNRVLSVGEILFLHTQTAGRYA